MTDSPAPPLPPAGPTTAEPPPSAPPAFAPAPALMRRDDRKVIAGVCSGLAYRLGIDPNVVRIVAIVLALFGGAGILLYVLGWLLLTEERTGQSLAERAVRGGAPDGAGSVLLAVALTLVAVGFAVVVVGDNWFGVAVLVVAIGVGALLLTRQPNGPQPGSAPVPVPTGTAPPQPYLPPASPAPWPGTDPASSLAAQPSPGLAPGALGESRAPRPEAGSAWPRPEAGSAWPGPMPVGPEPVERRPRSLLGPLTLFSAIAAVGALGVADGAGADVAAAAYIALPLAVVGAGLVLGAWFGRSRGLIALGVVLAMLLVPVAAVEQLGRAGGTSDAFETVVLTATAPADLDGAVVEYAAADVRWDMSRVDFTGTTVDAQISVGAGAVVVELPTDVTLVLDATVGAGEIDAFGDSNGGFGVSTSRTFEGTESGGTVNVTVEMGLGSVEVNRAQA